MPSVGTTYSFMDLTGAFVSPVVGTFLFSGNMGVGKIVVANTTEHGKMDTAPDGTVMPIYVAGNAGTVSIECQQTSAFHKYMLAWFNILNTAARNNDLTHWATSSILLRNVLLGTAHDAQYVSPVKVGDISYAESPTGITWNLLSADLINL